MKSHYTAFCTLILLYLLTPFSITKTNAQEREVVAQIQILGEEIITSLQDKEEWRLAIMDFMIYNEELSKKGVDKAAVVILESALKDKGIKLVERRRLGEVVEEIGL